MESRRDRVARCAFQRHVDLSLVGNDLTCLRRISFAAFGGLFGAGIAAGGFAPAHHLVDVLDVLERPWMVLITPPAVLALTAAVLAAGWGGRVRAHPIAWFAIALLLSAGAVSVTASDQARPAALFFGLALLSPIVLFVAGTTVGWHMEAAAMGFLLCAGLFAIRASVVFASDHGFPTGEDLFRAKFSNAPYDFHYYLLNNPDQSSAFFLMPFTWRCSGDWPERAPMAASLCCCFSPLRS